MSLPDITCPNCRAVVNGIVKDPVVFGCSACYNIFETDTNNALQPVAKLPRSIDDGNIKPKWLVLGAKIKRAGKVYTLSSVFMHGVDWNEQDSDGLTSGYSEYLEWYFVAADGSEFCLEQTDSDHTFQTRERISTTKSLVGKAEGKDLHDNWNPDYGMFSLLAFKGQDDEPLDRGRWNYKVVRNGASQISVEWKKDMPTTDWNAYKIKQIRGLDLERWRIRTDQEIQEAKEEFEQLGFYRSVFGISSLLMFLFILYSGTVGGKKLDCNSVWNFSAPTSDMKDSTLNINPAQYKRTFCTMKLEKNRPYCFSSRCSFAGNSNAANADFSIIIVKLPEGRIVNTIGASFFSEKGTDSEGAWTEETLSDYFYFRADETAEYEVTAVVEPQSLSNETRSGVLQITVSPTVLSRYFIAMFLIFSLIALILQWQWEYRGVEAGESKDTWLQTMFGK